MAGTGDAVEPAFSPDGKSLAYYADGAINVRGADGKEVELTDPARQQLEPGVEARVAVMKGDRSMPTVVLLGTLDTKGEEYAFFADRIREHGVDVVLMMPVSSEPRSPHRTSVARRL